jgi:hypothetical protein
LVAGAYGGLVELAGSSAREGVAAPVAELLVLDGPAKAADGLVPVASDAGEVRYLADLTGLQPLAAGTVERTLGPIVRAAQALAKLHERGRVHGDLRPAHVWTGPDGTLLSYPARAIDTGVLLRARLRSGADPREVWWVAPEVLAEAPATLASDVYALGALCYWALSGGKPVQGTLAPIGTLDVEAELSRLIGKALDPEPGRRPSLAELATRLEQEARTLGVLARESAAPAKPAPAAEPAKPAPTAEPAKQAAAVPELVEVEDAPPIPERVAAAVAANGAPEPRAVPAAAPIEPRVKIRVLSGPERSTRPELPEPEKRDVPVILVILLVLGGVSVLTGALWVAAVSWEAIGEPGRFAVLVLLTAAMYFAGRYLEKRGNARSGLALIALFSQLLWADGAFILGASMPGAWALVAGSIAGVGYALAAQRRSTLLGVLASIGAVIAIALTWVALDEVGHFVLVLVLTGGLAFTGLQLERRNRPELATALHVAWTILLWVDAGFLLDLCGVIDHPGGWAVAAAVIAALSGVVARSRSSTALGAMAGVDAVLGVIFLWAAVGESGHFLLLVLATVAVAWSAQLIDRPDRREAALALHFGWTSLLWIDAWFALDLAGRVERPGAWSAAAGLIALAALVQAVRSRSPFLSVVGSLGAATAHVLLGEALKTGSPEGPALWTFVGAFALGLIAWVLRRTGGDEVAAPPFFLALLFVVASAALGLAARKEQAALTFSVVWPYATAAAAGLVALTLRASAPVASKAALGATLLVLLMAPIWQAVEGPPATYALIALIAGGALVAAGSVAPIPSEARLAALFVGVPHIAVHGPHALTVSAVAVAFIAAGARERWSGWLVLGTLGAAVALVLWTVRIDPRSAEEGAACALGAAAVLAAIAFVGHRATGASGGGVAAGLAALAALLSFFVGLAALEHRGAVFAALWSLVIAATSIGLAHVLERAGALGYARAAFGVALTVLALGPTTVALAENLEHAYLFGASTVGAVTIVAGFQSRRLSGPAIQSLVLMVGLASVTIAPAILALFRLCDQNGDLLFGEVLSLSLTPAERLQHRLFYLSYLVGTASALVGLGVLFSRNATSKLPYRLLEVAGLFLFFGTLSLLSLARLQELLYPTVLFAGGLVALGAGAHQRHLVLVTIPAVFLVPNMWIQYFAKLRAANIPLGLLLVGFGIAVLVGAIVFERRVRPLLGEMKKEWA